MHLLAHPEGPRTVSTMTTDAAPAVRRPRSAAGAVPPQIALDVSRVIACAERVVELLGCGADLSVGPVIDFVLPSLAANLTQDLRFVVVRSATAFLVAHAPGQGEASADAWAADLDSTFSAATAPGTLSATIAALVSRGIDGERVTWDVISRETTRHEGLLHKECNRLVRTLPERSADELKGYGWAGLRIALRNYQPELGFAFSTYACPKINGAIRDGVRAESPIPKRLTTFVRKVSRVEEQLTHKLSRRPTYAEIAAYVDSSSESLHLLPRLTPAASLEELALGMSGESREPACLVDPANPQDVALTALRNEALHRAVAALPPEESQAVRLLMLEEVPVGEAAARVGIEPRQLRQRKQRALRALEPVMRAWMDEHVDAVA